MAVRVDHAQLIELCERLADATAARVAEWKLDGDDRYLWERPEGRISIGARDRDGEPPYELTVYNGDGEKVEELASALVDDDRPAAWNGALAELYRVARSSALHADEIIEALMRAIPTRGKKGKSEEDAAVTVRTSA
jgi:hypothetical protein